MHEFDSKDLKRLFGIPASQVRSLIKAGHISPLKKAGRLSYSFQDLIVLRTLRSLRAAKIPTQKINRTLREIRESLPGELPLSGLSIVAVGDRIVVREGQSLRESDTGQYTLALEFVDQGGELLMIDKRTNDRTSAAEENVANAASGAIEDDFERALALEESDAEGAIALYQACLKADARRMEARLNLGRLLHEKGRLRRGGKRLPRQQRRRAVALVQSRGVARGPRPGRRSDGGVPARHRARPRTCRRSLQLGASVRAGGQRARCAAPSPGLPTAHDLSARQRAQSERLLLERHRHPLADAAQQLVRNGVGPDGDLLDRQSLAPQDHGIAQSAARA